VRTFGDQSWQGGGPEGLFGMTIFPRRCGKGTTSCEGLVKLPLRKKDKDGCRGGGARADKLGGGTYFWIRCGKDLRTRNILGKEERGRESHMLWRSCNQFLGPSCVNHESVSLAVNRPIAED